MSRRKADDSLHGNIRNCDGKPPDDIAHVLKIEFDCRCRCVRGVVDAEDLPLITSRETLQQYKIFRASLLNLEKQCLVILAEITKRN